VKTAHSSDTPGNRLWNVLVAIDRTRREAYQRVMRDAASERIAAIGVEIAALREPINLLRKEKRQLKADNSAGPELVPGPGFPLAAPVRSPPRLLRRGGDFRRRRCACASSAISFATTLTNAPPSSASRYTDRKPLPRATGSGAWPWL
jgi:hypothetical protein